MDVAAFMGEAGHLLLRVLLVIAPLLVWQWTIALGQPYRASAGPVGLTVAASTMVGLAALAALMPQATLTWDAIVPHGGFWDLTLAEFLSLSFDIMRRAMPALLATLQFDDDQSNFQNWLAMAIALWLIRLAVGLIARPARGGWRFLGTDLASFIVGVFATIYAGPLLLWSVNRLNFWLFLLLILLIQDCRYDEPPLVFRLAGRLTRMPYRRERLPESMP